MTHPEHPVVTRPYGFPAQPVRFSNRWERRRHERACRKRGGHWWHPADPMGGWFCCQCGAERDGMPRDGT